MSENHDEQLYQIFRMAFQVLKEYSGTGSESAAADGIVDCLERLKNQNVPTSQTNQKQDFYRWLAVQCLRVSLDPSLAGIAPKITRHFVEVVDVHAKNDPLIVLNIVNMLVDSLSSSLNANSYFRRKGDAILVFKTPDLLEDDSSASVSSRQELRPVCLFFVSLVDGRDEIFNQLDQTYTFNILSVLVQIYQPFDRELGRKIITLFPHLVKAVHPMNHLEWDVIYSVFMVFYSTMESSQEVYVDIFDSLLEIITYVVSNFTDLNASIAELIVLLASQASYTIAQSDSRADFSPWVSPAAAVMDRIDFSSTYLDTIVPKLLATYRKEFVPLIDSYLVKSLDVDVESLPKGVNSTVIVEEKSPTWKQCLDIVKSVPTIAYTSDSYERMLDLASDLVLAGRRISFLLKFKHKLAVFEFFNVRNLRPLINVPFMCEECVCKPVSSKFASFVSYVKTMLGLSAEFTLCPRLIDSCLVEHAFILFTLPWQPMCTEQFSDSIKCDCLDGIVNLTYVEDRDKFLKYVAFFVRNVCAAIISEKSVTVVQKMLSCLILIVYNVSDAVVFEILTTLKEYLVPEKLHLLLNNECVGHKLLCFISGRCAVKMGAENWELLCADCDALEANVTLTKFALHSFKEYVAVKFRDFLSNPNFPLVDLNRLFLRFLNHSDHFRDPSLIEILFVRLITEPFQDSVLINEILYRLVYNEKGGVNHEVVSKIYQTVCLLLKKSNNGDFEMTIPRYESIIKIIKKMLKLPYPSSMAILKILMLFNLSPPFDTCILQALFKIALSSREITVSQFLKTHEPSLAKFTVNYMIHKANRYNSQITSSFLDILGVLNLKLDEVMGQLTLMSSILSEIIQKCNPSQSSPIIAQIAALFYEDIKTFLDKHYESIFARIYALDNDKITHQNLMPLFELTGLSFEKSLPWRYSQLVSKLILHSYHPLRVYRFLFHHKQNQNVEHHLADLKQHFIGCLTIIETDLPKNESLQTAKSYITCICKCIQTFGFEIVASIQVKLLTTLRICLPLYYNELPKHCLKAWTYFCFSVDVKTIGPYVITILVHLIPLLDKFPDPVSDIFHYFVVENGEHYPELLPSLYFVPCHPNIKMQQVWSVIQMSLLAKGSCCRNIFITLEGIYSESTETKKVSLERLRMCLSNHSSILCKSIEQDDRTAETILTCLLDNITYNNDEVKIHCAACLGELGAIDPARFGFNDSRSAYTPQKYDLTSDDFSVACITKIVHCLRKYDDSNITHILCSTLQELLRLHLENKSETEKSLYLEKFNINERYILVPLLHSKYIFKGVALDRKLTEITFEFHAGKTPCEWATIWATHMLFRMPPSRQRTVFSTCLSTMKIDIEVAEAILPYILLYSLATCSPSDVELIEREMKYILQWDLTKHRTKPDNLMMIVGESKKNIIHSDVSQTKYVSIVLDLLDFLNQVTSDCHFFKASLGLPNEEQVKEKIEDFVKRFPERAMSLKSFVQEDYCRALYYIEKDTADQLAADCLKPLRNIYSKLNDINGLVGVVKSSDSAPSPEETIVNHMVYGSVHDAVSGYERMCSKYKSTNVYRGLIQCYIEVNQPATALAISKQIINDNIYLRPDIFSEHVEALWSTSRYQEIDTLLEELNPRFSTGSMWSIDLVRIYRLLTKTNYETVLDEIKNTRLGIVNRLTNQNRSGMALYRQGYWYMVKLHILNDIEMFAQMQFAIRPGGDDLALFKGVTDRFKERLATLPAHGPFVQDVTKSCLQTLDTVFDSMKSKLTDEMKTGISSSLGTMWLNLAKKARNKRRLQEAYTCIGIAEKYNPSKLFIELAKYYQAKFETDTAVLVLERGLQKFDLTAIQNDPETLKICADATLLIAEFEVGSMNLDFNDGYVAFKKAVNICNLEKSFVRLATYLYKQHLTETEPDDTAIKRHIQFDAAQNFSKSLLYGAKHIYQSMPCILTLWLDFGARVATQTRTSRPVEVRTEMTKMLDNFNQLMENNTFLLPTYMFMTAFSQILSRINHRHPTCLEILSKIIIKILKEYPQQAMWSFYSVCCSTDSMQRERTAEIYKRIKGSDKEGGKFLKTFTSLAERLIDISMRKVKSETRQVNLNQISPKLQMMMEEIRNAPIMLPLQKFLTVHIAMRRTGDSSSEQHTPFPLDPIYITDVKSMVLILISIQMPKRLEFVGSDGQTYPLMCKKDDLRLDSRFMEFNTVINTLLRTDSITSEKDLTIRTYSVVPLNSECGIIEWLNGLSSLKSIIVDMYAKLNIQTMPVRQIKKLMSVERDQVTLQERLRRFVAEILPMHPPVLHKWFLQRHPCPEEWLHCRNAFVRSSAVMSIVGYIVGLGDRHCENILIDSATGEAVHVDFNMLFNRSDALTYPETVPFRLTRSMVRAMGATGVEGLFVNSAEMTARVVRHNSEQLLSVLKPFLYDIDVKSYNPKRHALKKSAALVTDDMSNDEAKINIHNVEMRLNGVVRCKNNQWAPHRDSKPLSVEGQTRMLIKEATSELNLCQMFVGWAPYL